MRAQTTTAHDRKQWARMGGLARAKSHTKEELSQWGKLGGRPPKEKGKGRQWPVAR
jgi:hypothetical protein